MFLTLVLTVNNVKFQGVSQRYADVFVVSIRCNKSWLLVNFDNIVDLYNEQHKTQSINGSTRIQLQMQKVLLRLRRRQFSNIQHNDIHKLHA